MGTRRLIFASALLAVLVLSIECLGNCSRCGSASGWCSECSGSDLCKGCRDKIWPYRSENKDFLSVPFRQRRRWEFKTTVSNLEETLGVKLIVVESRRCRVVTDISHKVAHDLSDVCEDYHGRFGRIFGLKRGGALFSGKCQMFVFKRYKTFRNFTEQVERVGVRGCSGGCTVVRGFEPKVVLFTQGRTVDEFVRTFIHEMTHVFLGLFLKDRSVEVWLHEGIAQYFEFAYKYENSRGPESEKKVEEFLGRGRLTPAPELMTMKIAPIDQQGYVEAWSLVTFMVKKGGERFGGFLRLLREGRRQEDALQESFGVSPWELNARWKQYLKKN